MIQQKWSLMSTQGVKNLCLHKNLYMDVYSDLIHNYPDLVTFCLLLCYESLSHLAHKSIHFFLWWTWRGSACNPFKERLVPAVGGQAPAASCLSSRELTHPRTWVFLGDPHPLTGCCRRQRPSRFSPTRDHSDRLLLLQSCPKGSYCWPVLY